MYNGLHVKCRLLLSDLMKLDFSRHIFEKNTQIENFVKIHPLETELFHADGQTDMNKLTVGFIRNFAIKKAPNNTGSRIENLCDVCPCVCFDQLPNAVS